jgi:hypothetical protein
MFVSLRAQDVELAVSTLRIQKRGAKECAGNLWDQRRHDGALA